MRVFVAGATGAIGKPLVAELLRSGHSVVGLARSERGLRELRDAGAEPCRRTSSMVPQLRLHYATLEQKPSSIN